MRLPPASHLGTDKMSIADCLPHAHRPSWISAALLAGFVALGSGTLYGQAVSPPDRGERIPPSQMRGEVVQWTTILARDAELRRQGPRFNRTRQGDQGVWEIPSRLGTYYPHSGDHNLINKWGDTSMGVGFPTPTDVRGVFVAGQAASGVWTTGLKAIGFRDGEMVDFTPWFEDIDETPRWFAIDLADVDRVVFVSRAVLNGGGWFALDDLTFTPRPLAAGAEVAEVVLDFEDCEYDTTLTGSGYAGLEWEVGTGDFEPGDVIPAPQKMEVPAGDQKPALNAGAARATSGGGATTPILEDDFQGVVQGDAGVFFIPPDTHGAIGPDHFVEVVNLNFAVYDRFTGAELQNIRLDAFHPGSAGDPRVLFDHHSGRWIVLNTDFSTDLYVAVSMTSDPLGSWFMGQFTASADEDAGCLPDYPTLGVDADGIYTSAFMASGCGMAIYAIEKAPLLTLTPAFGAITAFRGMGFEGAIQPVHTYGTPGAEYFISRNTVSSFRLRSVSGPLSSPTLNDLGTVSIVATSDPPEAPALNSTTDINTIDPRPLNAVFRNGSIWTTHDVDSAFGTAGCRWYEINPLTNTVLQTGTVEDASLHYYYSSIAVNVDGDVVMGFSGSNASQFVSAYYTGRRSTDPPGTMAPPVLLRAGVASYTVTDGVGRNRWGDYSSTTIDPLNDRTFFTIQEYVHAVNDWGTHIAKLGFCGVAPANDCNGNCIDDALDIGNISTDCNDNAIPDECDLAAMTSGDCNDNEVPDECEDCNLNGIADECELITVIDQTSILHTPFGIAFEPNEFTILNPPPPASDVTFTFTGNLPVFGTTDVVVTINGQPFPPDLVRTEVFESGVGVDCPSQSVDTIVLTPGQFNTATNNGDDLVVGMSTTDFLDSACDCCGITSIQVNVSYTGNVIVDANENGLLDECECAEDCSGDLDGNVGIEEFLAVLANWGASSTCDFSPSGGDGTVGIDEFLGVLASWGPCFTP